MHIDWISSHYHQVVIVKKIWVLPTWDAGVPNWVVFLLKAFSNVFYFWISFTWCSYWLASFCSCLFPCIVLLFGIDKTLQESALIVIKRMIIFRSFLYRTGVCAYIRKRTNFINAYIRKSRNFIQLHLEYFSVAFYQCTHASWFYRMKMKQRITERSKELILCQTGCSPIVNVVLEIKTKLSRSRALRSVNF